VKWFIPSWNGDFRLVEGVDGESQLLIMQPTPVELKMLGEFLKIARRKKWTTEKIADDEGISTRTIRLAASIEEAGPALVKIVKPKDRTLTAVAFKDGKLEVAETGGLATLAMKAKNEDATAAVSVARPTPCCPRCEVGAIAPANEVLQAFLTPEEHETWAKHRAIMVTGGTSGHQYLLVHRHTQTAARLGKICYDATDRFVLHFHDSSVPPEEEILAAKLILEHREPWLRNEATVLQLDSKGGWHDLGFMRYKNPFGDASDGRGDAALTASFGTVAPIVWQAYKALHGDA
jgi:transcriptional regulator with XRE-family HTH domain